MDHSKKVVSELMSEVLCFVCQLCGKIASYR